MSLPISTCMYMYMYDALCNTAIYMCLYMYHQFSCYLRYQYLNFLKIVFLVPQSNSVYLRCYMYMYLMYYVHVYMCTCSIFETIHVYCSIYTCIFIFILFLFESRPCACELLYVCCFCFACCLKCRSSLFVLSFSNT